jgi:hypothetical protein
MYDKKPALSHATRSGGKSIEFMIPTPKVPTVSAN